MKTISKVTLTDNEGKQKEYEVRTCNFCLGYIGKSSDYTEVMNKGLGDEFSGFVPDRVFNNYDDKALHHFIEDRIF